MNPASMNMATIPNPQHALNDWACYSQAKKARRARFVENVLSRMLHASCRCKIAIQPLQENGKTCKRKIGQFKSRIEQDSWMSLHAKSDKTVYFMHMNSVFSSAVLFGKPVIV